MEPVQHCMLLTWVPTDACPLLPPSGHCAPSGLRPLLDPHLEPIAHLPFARPVLLHLFPLGHREPGPLAQLGVRRAAPPARRVHDARELGHERVAGKVGREAREEDAVDDVRGVRGREGVRVELRAADEEGAVKWGRGGGRGWGGEERDGGGEGRG